MVVVQTLDNLPDCILLYIFKFVKSKETTLWRNRIVCKRWHRLLADGELWKRCNLSRLNLKDPQLVHAIVQWLPMNVVREVVVSDKYIPSESIFTILQNAYNLKRLSLESCKLERHDTYKGKELVLKTAGQNLRHLDIRRTNGNFSMISQLIETSSSSLQILACSENFNIISAQSKRFFNRLENLTVFECRESNDVSDRTIYEVSTSCPSLSSLNITGCLGVIGSSFGILLRNCKKLGTLILQNTGILDEEVLKVPWLNSRIKELDISSCKKLKESGCQHMVRHLTYLRCAFTDNLLFELTSMDLCLKNIGVRRRYILDVEVVVRFLSKCRMLEALDLTSIPITSLEFERILPNLSKLRWLKIAGNQLLQTVDSLSLLLKYCQQLQGIGINYYHSNCHESLHRVLFRCIKSNSNIQQIDLEGVNVDGHFLELTRMIKCGHIEKRNRRLKITRNAFELPDADGVVDTIYKMPGYL